MTNAHKPMLASERNRREKKKGAIVARLEIGLWS